MDRPIKKKSSFKKVYVPLAILLCITLSCYYVFSGYAYKRMGKASLELKEVRKGAFGIYLIGNGELVPRNVDYVISKNEGILISAQVKSGDHVKKGQILFEIENEELTVEYGNQQLVLAEAESILHAKTFELQTHELELQRSVLQAESAYNMQREEFEAYKKLLERPNPPVSHLLFQQSQIREAELKKTYELELKRLDNFRSSIKAQLTQYEFRVNLAKNKLARTHDSVEDLKLKSKLDGVIQDVDLKPGQRVLNGTTIGLISNPDEMYVRLKVSAVQGNKLSPGQRAIVTIKADDYFGRVVRIDPNVKGTTIDVDIELEQDLKLPGNMFVSGKIIADEVSDSLYVDAPSNVIENGISSFYRLSKDGAYLELVKVGTGLLSAGRVQIKTGLSVSDSIVVSDTSKFNGASRISLY